jgi:ribonuclease Z
MTVLRVTFLGTSAAQPTIRRGLSASFVQAHGERLLVDCGEGTQRQMLRYGTGFAIDLALFTHFHADHYLGIIGFSRTLAMQDREAELELYGPGPFLSVLADWIRVGGGELPYAVHCRELAHGAALARTGYRITAIGVDHRGPALGYVFEEPARPGVFDVAQARALRVPEGPLYKALQSGNPVTLPDGRDVMPDAVVGPPRPGRKVVFSGDTRPCQALIDAARGADLIIHDSTFSEADKPRALQTHHSTALEAAQVAAKAGARRLVLTHLSARYDTSPDILLREASTAFGGEIVVAEDGLSVDVPLRG